MYNIHFWHGMSGPDYRSKDERKLLATLENMSHIVKVEESKYGWDGTLDEFANEYPSMFIVMKTTICVTQHSNFGQR